MSQLKHLIDSNRAWAEGVRADDPAFFERLSGQQAPKYFWIGCSDSRVPANQVTGLAPGEVFVHRNIANVMSHGDLNCLSVLQFAVDILKVEHVIVCGHYGCGGVHAAMTGTRVGLADNWIRHVGDIASSASIGIQPVSLISMPEASAAIDPSRSPMTCSSAARVLRSWP